jgi:hypothetical protein
MLMHPSQKSKVLLLFVGEDSPCSLNLGTTEAEVQDGLFSQKDKFSHWESLVHCIILTIYLARNRSIHY